MGQPKQLLPWGDGVVIEKVVSNLTAAGASPVICVTGFRSDEVSAALTDFNVCVVHNPNYASGEMLESFQIGINALQKTAVGGALLALGDQPHIPVGIISSIVKAAMESPNSILIPSVERRRGHPIFLPRSLWPALLELGQKESLRTLFDRFEHRIDYVSVESKGVRRDMDYPDEYRTLRRRYDHLYDPGQEKE